LNQKVVKAKRFNSFGLRISWIIHFKKLKEKYLPKNILSPDQSECREKILISFKNYSIWWECIKMRKMKLTKNIVKHKKKLNFFFSLFRFWQKKKLLNFFPFGKISLCALKSCHGPLKSHFFCDTDFDWKNSRISLGKKRPKSFFLIFAEREYYQNCVQFFCQTFFFNCPKSRKSVELSKLFTLRKKLLEKNNFEPVLLESIDWYGPFQRRWLHEKHTFLWFFHVQWFF